MHLLASNANMNTVLFVLLSFVMSALSVPMPQSKDAPTLPSTDQLANQASNTFEGADATILAIIFIATGLAFTFYGAKLFRVCLFLAGAYFCALFAVALVARFEPSGGFSNPRLVYLITLAVAAIVGGFLFLFFYRLGCFAIGAFGGYTLALFVLTLRSGGLIQSSWGQFAFILVMAILGGLAVLFVEPHAVRISTAIGGSYLTILGVDVFAKTGFAASARHFVVNPSLDFVASNSVYGMVAATVVLALLGIWVQYKKTCPEYRGYRSVGK